MHLGYLDQLNNEKHLSRRNMLKGAGVSLLAAGITPVNAFTPPKQAIRDGFIGSDSMNMSTAEDWIDTFYTGGAETIINYYADDFVFEDITLFQTITDKEQLWRAFFPFGDHGSDSPYGVHNFDVIRYDGGKAGDSRGVLRNKKPDNYAADEWLKVAGSTMAGADYEYDEWCVMNWVWRAKHNADEFMGIKGTRGKTTHTRGITFHMYKDRKIVREFTYWNFRDVAIQLGGAQPPYKFWLEKEAAK